MGFPCFVVFGFFVMLKLVSSVESSNGNETSKVVSSVGFSEGNETSKVVSSVGPLKGYEMPTMVFSLGSSKDNETSKVISSVSPVETSIMPPSLAPLEDDETLTNATSVEDSDNGNKTKFKRVFSVIGMTPSNGLLEHLEKRLGLTGGEPKLEHAEEALSYAYKWLNLDMPVCLDHPPGSRPCLLMQFEGLRNKSKELDVYDHLVSLQEFFYLFEIMMLSSLNLVLSSKGLILDNLENNTDVHYLRCQRFFQEAKNDSEIIKLRHVFRQNESIIEEFCRNVDRVFSYRYGEIEKTGLLVLPLPVVKERLLKCGDKYAPEIKLIDAMMRLQVMDEELFVIFTTPAKGHRDEDE